MGRIAKLCVVFVAVVVSCPRLLHQRTTGEQHTFVESLETNPRERFRESPTRAWGTQAHEDDEDRLYRSTSEMRRSGSSSVTKLQKQMIAAVALAGLLLLGYTVWRRRVSKTSESTKIDGGGDGVRRLLNTQAVGWSRDFRLRRGRHGILMELIDCGIEWRAERRGSGSYRSWMPEHETGMKSQSSTNRHERLRQAMSRLSEHGTCRRKERELTCSKSGGVLLAARCAPAATASEDAGALA
ncbi:hypothetical protein BESB_043000 [Besnoitia besnoiti]|uniref:Transmembrane protein n=1 Tax=Besnoitia besnoiti TaxID=94643 RepID=A0A2A9M3Y8_BESBE|nr:uncharacterized protein BESB_043000 [Besnoitia besnoiti]PFH31021.1 hypothetical protein BESB_043000 [Besnoitia besnoiti]